MKKLTAIFILLVTGIIPSIAQSMLKVSLTDRKPITISLDSRYFNKRGESVTVGDLPQGRHYLKISILDQNRQGTNYERTIYEGKIKTYRGQVTNIIYDAYNGTIVATEEDIQPLINQPVDATHNAQNYNNRNLNNYDQRDGQHNDNNNTQPDNNNTYNERREDNHDNTNGQATNNKNSNNTSDGFVNSPLPPGTPLASPETPEKATPATPAKAAKLDKLKKKIAAKPTDTDKFNTLKEALKKDKFTTAQVCTIMEWFTFESSKVEFAQWAYPNTTDKVQFNKVKDKLPTKSYRQEIDKFLKDQK